VSETDRHLMAIYRQLGDDDRRTLLAFAEFLLQRNRFAAPPVVPTQAPLPEPETLPRPVQESVVAALKRLAKTYPMLDKTEMLSATSDLVARHILEGTGTTEVIDRLEEIFAARYRKLKQDRNDSS
jgi:hypothetical protein